MRGNKKSVVALSAAVGASLLMSGSTKAANYVWNALVAGNASGSWNVPGNFTPAGTPTAADTVDFSQLDITLNSTVTLDAPQAASVITFGDANPATPATWTINSSTTAANDNVNLLNFTTTDNPTINVLGAAQVATINATLSDASVSSTTWGLAKGGPGTLVLTANNSTLTGVIYINNGTLSLNFSNTWSPAVNIIGDSSSGSSNGAHLEFQGGTLNLTGSSLNGGGTNSQTFTGGTNAGIGASYVTFNQNGAASLSLNLGAITRGTLSEAGGNVKEPGATIDISLPANGTVTATSPTGAGGIINDANGTAFVTVNNGADWAALNGSNNVVAGSSVAGFYTPSSSPTFAGNIDMVSDATLTAPSTVSSIRQNDTVAHTLNLNGNTLNTGGILMTPTAGGALTIQGGTLLAPNALAADIVVDQNNTNFPMTISASIQNNGGNFTALTKDGAGTLILTGANTASGDVVVNQGTLSVPSGTVGVVGFPYIGFQVAPAYGNSGTVNLSGTGAISDDHFDISGNENNFAGGTGVVNQTGGTITNGAWFSVGSFGNATYNFSAGTNTIEGGFASFEVGVFGPGVGTANISGTAQLIMENSSVITMSDAGSTGNNTINQNGGTVTLYSDAGVTPGGGGGVIIGGGGTGNDNYNLNNGVLTTPYVGRTSTAGTGNLNLNGGTLRASVNTSAFISGLTAANVQAGGAIIDTNGLTVTVPQPLLHYAALGTTPDGGLNKNGAGTLILSGASTYTGHTTINQGIVQLPATSAPIPAPIGAYSFDNVNDNANGNGTGNPITSGTLAAGDVVVNSGTGGTALNGVVNTADYAGSGSGASLVAGKFGNGLQLDGLGTSVDIPSQITPSSGTVPYTLSVWVNTTLPGAAFVSKNNGGDTFNTGNMTYYLGTNPPSGTPGTLPTGVQNTGGFLQGGTPVVDNMWHMLTFVSTGSSKSVYVDGVLATTTVTGMNQPDNSTVTRIGFNADIYSQFDGNTNFAGILDEMDFFNVGLTQQQIQELYTDNDITTGTSAGSQQILPSDTAVVITAAGAGLDLNGNNQMIGSLAGVTGSTVTLGTATLTTGNDNTNTTFAGVISGNGGISKTGTGVFTLTGANLYAGPTSVSGTGTLVIGTAGALPLGTNLTIGAGSTVDAANHGAGPRILLEVSSLNLAGATSAWTGKLDLANNDMIIHNGSATSIENQIHQGYNGGNWGGSEGITSSTAAGTTNTALGYELNSNGTGVLIGNFDGQTATSTDVLVKYTYFGDANLDGVVNGSDYTLIDNGFNNSLTGWHNGDFNYDGVVNGDDYTLIDNAFNTQGASLADISAGAAEMIASDTSQVAGGSSAVPEPASLGLLGIAAAATLGWRRRRS